MRDAEVEGPAQDRPLGLDRLVVAEVVPEPERHRGQLQPTASTPPVRRVRVAVVGGDEGIESVHVLSLSLPLGLRRPVPSRCPQPWIPVPRSRLGATAVPSVLPRSRLPCPYAA